MAAWESLPRRGHGSPIQPRRDGGALQGESLGRHQEKWGWGQCHGETSKEVSVQVGLTMAGTWVAEWRGRPVQHPFHPHLQPRTLSSERAGRWCFLSCYLYQELLFSLQRPHRPLCASHGACVTGETSRQGSPLPRGVDQRWSLAGRGF